MEVSNADSGRVLHLHEGSSCRLLTPGRFPLYRAWIAHGSNIQVAVEPAARKQHQPRFIERSHQGQSRYRFPEYWAIFGLVQHSPNHDTWVVAIAQYHLPDAAFVALLHL